MGIGDWGLGIGDWGLGIGPNPQSPIPNPQSPIPNNINKFKLIKSDNIYIIYKLNYIKIINVRSSTRKVSSILNNISKIIIVQNPKHKHHD